MLESKRLNRDAGECTGKRTSGLPQKKPWLNNDTVILRCLRVLIVDDEHAVADSLCVAVDSWGHVSQVAYDGASALKAVEDQRPDVALLDIAMPGMDGYELAWELRVAPTLRGCFLIAMRGMNDERGGPGAEGVLDLFLAKPINLVVLRDLLMVEGGRLDGVG